MNTPIDDGHFHLRYAEYVLGVLDADARAEVEHEMTASDAAATAVVLWQHRLLPMAEEIVSREPPAYVWHRIRSQLALDVPSQDQRAAQAPGQRPGLWNNLRFWHWLGAGTSVLAAVFLVLLLLPSRRPVAPVAYMASTITQSDGQVGWTATMDIGHGRMVVVPARPQAIAPGRAPELWLIPEGEKPIAVGMIGGSAPSTLKLDPALLAKLGPSAALAVSVEPPGGSPTGQPTGPVIAKGSIGASPEAARGQPVSLLSRPDDKVRGDS